MTLLLPTRLTFTIFTAHRIHAYIRLVKPIPSGTTVRLEGDGWVNWSELATSVVDSADVVASALSRFLPVKSAGKQDRQPKWVKPLKEVPR